MKSPIIAIQGGLGNQLFQWFFDHTISEDAHFRIDPLYEMSVVGSRNFELQPLIGRCSHVQLALNQDFLSPLAKSSYGLLDGLWEFIVLRRFVEGLGYIREDPRIDQSQSEGNSRNIKYAKGYFQKQAAIEKVFSYVKQELEPVLQETLGTFNTRMQLGNNYTVLHVRRGDYESAEFTPINIGTLSDEYFSRGLEGMETSNLIILTEIREDVAELVKTFNPRLVLDKSDTTPWETLAIMYGASQFLGANSSLSWWGARLCSANGGEVWLPSQWSYWKNIDPTDYHFPGSNIANVYWVQGNA